MSAVIKKEYKLGPGGLVGRGGVIHRPGDSMWLTDDEYEKSNKARLTLVSAEGKVVREQEQGAVVVPEQANAAASATPAEPLPPPMTPRSVSAPDPASAPTPAPDLTRAIQSAQDKAAALASVRNWDEFVANATAESLITYIQDSTTDEIKAIREAEKGRGKQKRVKVVSAANAALRRINMAKARAKREEKLAERKAEMKQLPAPGASEG